VSASPRHGVSLRDLLERAGVAMSWREILSLPKPLQHPDASQSQSRQRSLFWRSHTVTAVGEEYKSLVLLI